MTGDNDSLHDEYDKVTQASMNGIYVKAQELDRDHNDAPAPTAAPPGAFADTSTHASDAETHASDMAMHASDAATHASDAQTHASDARTNASDASAPAGDGVN